VECPNAHREASKSVDLFRDWYIYCNGFSIGSSGLLLSLQSTQISGSTECAFSYTFRPEPEDVRKGDHLYDECGGYIYWPRQVSFLTAASRETYWMHTQKLLDFQQLGGDMCETAAMLHTGCRRSRSCDGLDAENSHMYSACLVVRDT